MTWQPQIKTLGGFGEFKCPAILHSSVNKVGEKKHEVLVEEICDSTVIERWPLPAGGGYAPPLPNIPSARFMVRCSNDHLTAVVVKMNILTDSAGTR